MGNSIGSGGVTDVFTATHVIFIISLAMIAAIAIWWGNQRRRETRRAEDDARARREEAGYDAADSGSADPAPKVTPPVTPPPPPLGRDEPIPASAPQEANPAAQAADESIAATPAPDAPIAAEPVAAPAAGDGGLADQPVTLIKGLGPKVAARLAENGYAGFGENGHRATAGRR